MLRWVLVLAGLGMCALGVYWKWQRPFRPKATDITLADVPALLAAGRPKPVRLNAGVEQAHTLYPTGLKRPAFAPCRPGELHHLADVVVHELPDLVGCVVVLRGRLATDKYALRRGGVRRGGVRPGGVRRGGPEASAALLRHLVPVSGTEAQLWVLSPAFAADSQEESAWLARSGFHGRLARLAELGENLRGWFRLATLQRLFGEHRGTALPAQATVIITHPSGHPAPRAPALASAYVPVAGSQGRLFVERPVHDPDFKLPAPLEGNLTPTSGRVATELGRAAGNGDIRKVGILRIPRASPPEHRQRQLFGVLTVAAAAMCFMWVVRRLRTMG